MASQEHVRQYLAYWFQLGKRVLIHGGRESMLPQPVIQGNRYSAEFEACWRRIMTAGAGDCYLEGTPQTIQELLSPTWDISPCSRCDMPVPMLSLGATVPSCPCSDMPSWPDLGLPRPRSPVDSNAHLSQIRDRLMQTNRSAANSSSNLSS